VPAVDSSSAAAVPAGSARLNAIRPVLAASGRAPKVIAYTSCEVAAYWSTFNRKVIAWAPVVGVHTEASSLGFERLQLFSTNVPTPATVVDDTAS
jgi:hypothetical protein